MEPTPSINGSRPAERPARRYERVRLGYFGEAQRLPRWRGPAERVVFTLLALGILAAAIAA